MFNVFNLFRRKKVTKRPTPVSFVLDTRTVRVAPPTRLADRYVPTRPINSNGTPAKRLDEIDAIAVAILMDGPVATYDAPSFGGDGGSFGGGGSSGSWDSGSSCDSGGSDGGGGGGCD